MTRVRPSKCPREDEDAINRILLRRVQSGDETAFDELIKRNRGLVRWVVGHLELRSSDGDDLEQEGLIALYQAALRWDPDRGVRYSTFATKWILGAVKRANFVRDYPTAPATMRRDIVMVRWARNELLQKGTCEPTPSQIASASGLPMDRVEAALSLMRPVESFDGDSERNCGFKLAADPDSRTTTLDDWVSGQEVDRLLASLGEREARVLMMRFGLGGHRPASLDEVAKAIGGSTERVRLIEARALSELRRTGLSSAQ